MIVRDEQPQDRRAIREMIRAAFGRSDEADLVDGLRADGDSVVSLVAVDRGTIIGHVLFSRMTAPFRALAMAPVSVVPGGQRLGIGTGLIREGLGRAAHAGWHAVFVVGDPGYYGRFGFSADAAKNFSSPYAPYLMVLPLEGALPATTGEIAYAPAFRRLDLSGAPT